MSGIATCEQCSEQFERNTSAKRPARFCTLGCYHDWRRANNITSGCFKPGNVPWTAGKKGIRNSPATEFKKGCESAKRVPVGTETVRHRKREKHPRAFVKTAEPNTWMERARFVWEQANGPVPRGMVIHHEDRNPLNDDIGNLRLMTRAEHRAEHSAELAESRIQAFQRKRATQEARADL